MKKFLETKTAKAESRSKRQFEKKKINSGKNEFKKRKKQIKKFQTVKCSGLDGFKADIYQTYKQELISIFSNYSKKLKRIKKLPNSFYEATITQIPKLDNGIIRRENYRPLSLMSINENSSSKY